MAIQIEVSEKEVKGNRKWKNGIFWYYNFHYLNYCTTSWVFLQGHCFAAKQFLSKFPGNKSRLCNHPEQLFQQQHTVTLGHISTFPGYYQQGKVARTLRKARRGHSRTPQPAPLLKTSASAHSSLLECCRCYPWLNFPLRLMYGCVEANIYLSPF